MKNTNQPIAFAFEENAVRVVPNAERPLFVAKDVATALGYAKPENAIARHCKNSTTTPKQGGGSLSLIGESDVYRLIFGSKLESAEKFQDWVFEEVLPSIRKTGEYGVSDNTKLRQQELHLKLLQALERATNPQVRESIHASLAAVSADLGFPVIALDDFNWGHIPAAERATAIAVCTRFWSAVEWLNKEENINVDHSHYAGHIAVNLNEVIRLADAHDCPPRADLLRYLRYSDHPAYQQIKSVNSRHKKKTVKCWIFTTS